LKNNIRENNYNVASKYILLRLANSIITPQILTINYLNTTNAYRYSFGPLNKNIRLEKTIKKPQMIVLYATRLRKQAPPIATIWSRLSDVSLQNKGVGEDISHDVQLKHPTNFGN
jgi:hypothetical protein